MPIFPELNNANISNLKWFCNCCFSWRFHKNPFSPMNANICERKTNYKENIGIFGLFGLLASVGCLTPKGYTTDSCQGRITLMPTSGMVSRWIILSDGLENMDDERSKFMVWSLEGQKYAPVHWSFSRDCIVI